MTTTLTTPVTVPVLDVRAGDVVDLESHLHTLPVDPDVEAVQRVAADEFFLVTEVAEKMKDVVLTTNHGVYNFPKNATVTVTGRES